MLCAAIIILPVCHGQMSRFLARPRGVTVTAVTVILAVAADQAAAADTEPPALADPTEVDRALASKSS